MPRKAPHLEQSAGANAMHDGEKTLIGNALQEIRIVNGADIGPQPLGRLLIIRILSGHRLPMSPQGLRSLAIARDHRPAPRRDCA